MIFGAAELYAFFVRDAPRHWEVVGQIELAAASEELVVSPFVIAELEGLVRETFGLPGWLAVLEQLGNGAWTIAGIDAEHLTEARERVEAGGTLAEASVAVLGAS